MGATSSRVKVLDSYLTVEDATIQLTASDHDYHFQDVKLRTLIPNIFEAYDENNNGWLELEELYQLIYDQIANMRIRGPEIWKKNLYKKVDDVLLHMKKEYPTEAAEILIQWNQDKLDMVVDLNEYLDEKLKTLENDPVWLRVQAKKDGKEEEFNKEYERLYGDQQIDEKQELSHAQSRHKYRAQRMNRGTNQRALSKTTFMPSLKPQGSLNPDFLKSYKHQISTPRNGLGSVINSARNNAPSTPRINYNSVRSAPVVPGSPMNSSNIGTMSTRFKISSVQMQRIVGSQAGSLFLAQQGPGSVRGDMRLPSTYGQMVSPTEGLLNLTMVQFKALERSSGIPANITYGQIEPWKAIPRYVFLAGWRIAMELSGLAFSRISRLMYNRTKVSRVLASYILSIQKAYFDESQAERRDKLAVSMGMVLQHTEPEHEEEEEDSFDEAPKWGNFPPPNAVSRRSLTVIDDEDDGHMFAIQEEGSTNTRNSDGDELEDRFMPIPINMSQNQYRYDNSDVPSTPLHDMLPNPTVDHSNPATPSLSSMPLSAPETPLKAANTTPGFRQVDQSAIFTGTYGEHEEEEDDEDEEEKDDEDEDEEEEEVKPTPVVTPKPAVPAPTFRVADKAALFAAAYAESEEEEEDEDEEDDD